MKKKTKYGTGIGAIDKLLENGLPIGKLATLPMNLGKSRDPLAMYRLSGVFTYNMEYDQETIMERISKLTKSEKMENKNLKLLQDMSKLNNIYGYSAKAALEKQSLTEAEAFRTVEDLRGQLGDNAEAAERGIGKELLDRVMSAEMPRETDPLEDMAMSRYARFKEDGSAETKEEIMQRVAEHSQQAAKYGV